MSEMFVLRHKGPVPNGGKPFLVELVHTVEGEVRVTLDPEKAKRFHDSYLSKTVWNWSEKYEKVAV